MRQHIEFETWGTYVHLQTTHRGHEAERIARALLARIDAACSRFRPDSDLARVNRRPGSWVTCSPLLLDALEVALAAARVTDGMVDPLVGRSLVELGYDRDFRALTPRRSAPVTSAPVPGAWQQIALDRSAQAVRIPAGTALDLGATAKAWASDLLAGALVDELQTSTLVSLGGDIRMQSPAGETATWSIRITEEPRGSGAACTVTLDGGGLATSSTRVRRWRAGGSSYHHLIDPRTGQPATGPWRTVSATGPSCLAANLATTTALVLQADAPEWLTSRGVDARLVDTSGDLRVLGRWPTDGEEPACRAS